MSERLNETIYCIVESGPWLEAAKAWRAYEREMRIAWNSYCEKIGADRYWTHGAFGFPFRVNPPEGWTKPNRKGMSQPKKTNKEALTEIQALPRKRTHNFFDLPGIVSSISYKSKDGGSGWSRIGRTFEDVQCGWCGDILYITMPSPKNKTINHLAENPDNTVENQEEYLNWTPPEGLREVSQAEIDYMHAKAKLEEEQKEKANAKS